MRKKKPNPRKKTARGAKAPRVTTAAIPKRIGAAKKIIRRKKAARRKKHIGGKGSIANVAALDLKGMGAESGGQSGDVQGLSRVAGADSESVEELAEEGQAFEAELISGMENAPDDDTEEVTTREVPEDDVPPEYLEDN